MVDLPFADAKVHSDLMTARLRRGLHIDSYLLRGVPFIVEVEGGILDGVRTNLDCRRCRVGTSMESNVILFDKGIEDEHAELHFKSSIFGPVVSVRALGPEVLVAGKILKSQEATDYLALPLKLSINGVTLNFSPRTESKRTISPKLLKTWRYLSKTAIVCLLLLGLTLFSNYQKFDLRVAPKAAPSPYKVVQSDDASSKRLADVAEAVQVKLTELRLTDYVTATVDNSGAVALAGSLTAEKQSSWHAFRQWYDLSNNPVLLSKVSVAPNLNNFPRIASVKLSDPARIQLSNGGQLSVGDEVVDGHILKSIEPTHIIVTVRGEDLRISFAGEMPNGGQTR